jgi:hypothetical protein
MVGLVYRVQVTDSAPIGVRASGTNYVEWTGNRTESGTETVSVRVKQPISLFPLRFARLTIQRSRL